MNDWAVSIGTGPSQAPLIRAAARAGLHVLGVDRSPDLTLVNDALTVSTHDSDTLLQSLVKHPLRQRICAVLARTSGPAIMSAARAADFLGLPGFGIGFAEASVSKAALRSTCERLGLRAVDGQCTACIPEWATETDWVIKPDQPIYGKRNVYRVRNPEQLADAFNAAAEESVNGLVECQPYQAGRDLGLMLALVEGKSHWHFFYEELVAERDGKFQAVGVAGPAKGIAAAIQSRMQRTAERLAAVWGSSGFAFFSFRVPAFGPPLLYEVNPGLCGDGLADQLFPALWPDQDFFAQDVALMRGANANLPAPPRSHFGLVNGHLLTGQELEEVVTNA